MVVGAIANEDSRNQSRISLHNLHYRACIRNTTEEAFMKRTFCDGCGSMIAYQAENQGGRNLHVHIGDYQVSLSVCKENMLIDLCQKCLIEVGSFCLLEIDPFVTRTEDTAIEEILSKRRSGENGDKA